MREKELTATPLMNIIWGFADTQVLGAAVQKELFSKLSGRKGGINLEEAVQLLEMESRPTQMLLTYCTALGLLEEHNGHYCNSPLSERFLVQGTPDYFGNVVTMWKTRLYPSWLNLEKALEQNQPQTWKPEESGHFESIFSDIEELRIFCAGMDGLSRQTAKALVEVFDLSDHSRILDIGGGSGAFCIELVRLCPNLQGAIFDLPPPLEIAREKIAEARMDGRIQICPGNFFEKLPTGYDIHLFSMIFHDWLPEEILKILQKSFEALSSGGTAIISELMMDDDKTGPLLAARMSMNMLIENNGCNYTWAEYEEWLNRVGFIKIQRFTLESPGANGIIVGTKP